MRANEGNGRVRTWRKLVVFSGAAALALSVIGGGAATAANSRIFSVAVGNPTAVSQGGATKFDVTVQSGDNQTIANVVLRIPTTGQTWPTGLTISAVFGLNAAMCEPTDGVSLVCDFGNIAAFGSRRISVLANVAASVPAGNSITFTASAETNNENGSNVQIMTGTSTPLVVLPFDANAVTTFNLGGKVSTSALGQAGAGNLQTTLNLLQNNGGNGNAILISEGTSSTQPTICVSLKLTCQPDFTEVTVNGGDAVSPYLETILTANVPKTYNIKKAFVIHLKSDGSLDTRFPLYNSSTTSCLANPGLVPCADFSLSKTNVLTVVVHSTGNGKFNY